MYVSYLDNTLIYLATAEDHTKHARAVFEWFAKSKFYVKCKKMCIVFTRSRIPWIYRF